MEYGFQEAQIMKCQICWQAETSGGLTTVTFERGEMKFMVTHVPAWICRNCGESYVEADVAERLLLRAEQMAANGEISAVWEYE
jgi:YgiT-type zinc finger domain-containing protein